MDPSWFHICHGDGDSDGDDDDDGDGEGEMVAKCLTPSYQVHFWK